MFGRSLVACRSFLLQVFGKVPFLLCCTTEDTLPELIAHRYWLIWIVCNERIKRVTARMCELVQFQASTYQPYRIGSRLIEECISPESLDPSLIPQEYF